MNQIMKKSEYKKEEKQEKEILQAGGHTDAFEKGENGTIKKKVSKNEREFYVETWKNNENLHPLTPKFLGVSEDRVIMEDLLNGYNKPSIMDIKMRISSVGEDASEEKRQKMQQKDQSTTTVSLGMRITALKVWNVKTKEYNAYDKSWGKKVVEKTMLDSLKVYFDNGEKMQMDLIDLFLEKLGIVLKHFENQRKFRFYSSSVLFVYDSQPNEKPKIDLKMIDFAHVSQIKDGGLDDGYIFGIKNLMKYLNELKNIKHQ